GRLLDAQRCDYVRRTSLAQNGQDITGQLAAPGVMLLDTLGELSAFFDLADAVFIGGSLVATGGHNLLEPAWWEKAIIFGPHMENFRDAARIFLDAGGAIEVPDASGLAVEILRLFGDESRRKLIGQAALGAVRRESGATQRILDHLSMMLDEPAPSRQPEGA
ncbi:MAG: 3-deoxy-D-manno-octulosonic acid transferase, partial [Terriglobia bacterium]